MQLVLIVVHLMIALAMVGIILIQRSEGGGMAGLGGGGSGGGFLTTRGTANLLTRTTAILAGLFMATSLLLTILAGRTLHKPSILSETPAQINDKLTPVMEEKLLPPVANHKNQAPKES